MNGYGRMDIHRLAFLVRFVGVHWESDPDIMAF